MHPPPTHTSAPSFVSREIYRPDIDGLRAVAVLLVLFYHAFPTYLSGGFIGVDIFFVISGYLISAILFREIKNNTFSVLKFYQRRILRIFPALAIVLFSSLLYGWFTLMASEYAQLGSLTAASAGFVANEVLREQSGYFDFTSSSKPLLHLWSLGIEEQFYLFWPGILAISSMVCNSGKIIIFWAFLWLISFLTNCHWVHQYPENVFYSIPTRFWELLSGGLLAWWSSQAPHFSTDSPRFNALLGLLASALLLVPVIFLNPDSAFPGFWALLPVASATLLIFLPPKTWTHRLLGHPLMVKIGLISYPLYLWHWPLLVFARQANYGSLNVLTRLVLLGCSGLLASLTYLLVEKPIRSGRFSRDKLTSVLLLTLLLLGGAGGWIKWQNGFPARPIARQFAAMDEASGDWDYPGIAFDGSHLKTNVLQGTSAEQTVFLGDSHMEQFWPRLASLYQEHPEHYTLVFATYDGCPFLPELNRPAAPEFPAGGCARLYQVALRIAQHPQVKAIVIDNFWENYRHWPGFYPAVFHLSQQLAAWHAQGIKTYLLASNPSGRAYIPQNQVRRLPFLHCPDALVRRTAVEAAMQTTRPLIYATALHSHAQWIDPMDSLCDESTCSVVDEQGVPVNKDANHLRAGWVEDHADFMDAIVLPQDCDNINTCIP